MFPLSALSLLMTYFFFFDDTATPDIYTTYDTLSLHDALPICLTETGHVVHSTADRRSRTAGARDARPPRRSRTGRPRPSHGRGGRARGRRARVRRRWEYVHRSGRRHRHARRR